MRKAEIREAVRDDLEQLLALYTQMDGNKMPEELPYALWEEILKDPRHHIIVAEEDGGIVSTCTVDITMNLTHGQQPFATVENVLTHPKHRGKGYATACLAYAREIAKTENCYKITLTTGSKRETTLRLYEKAGYNRLDKTAFVQWL